MTASSAKDEREAEEGVSKKNKLGNKKEKRKTNRKLANVQQPDGVVRGEDFEGAEKDVKDIPWLLCACASRGRRFVNVEKEREELYRRTIHHGG